MHPVCQPFDPFFKQCRAAIVWAAVQMMCGLVGTLAVGAFVIQQILDTCHVAAICAMLRQVEHHPEACLDNQMPYMSGLDASAALIASHAT